jgi:hypothetical protein
MKGKRESPEEECEENYPEACRWPGNDLWTGDENFRRIVLQETDLLGACQLFVSELGLDPVPDGGRVSIGGLGLLSGATGGASCSQASLAHDDGAQQDLRGRGGRKDALQEKCAGKKMMAAEWGKQLLLRCHFYLVPGNRWTI